MTLYGIYCYMDKDDNDSIVYIGKDSHIDKHLRRRQHLQPSRRNHQPINRILQNNPNRYYYKVLSAYNPSFKPKELINTLEESFINHFNHKFNFTKGGDGIKGFHNYHSTNHNLNISKSQNTSGYYRVRSMDNHGHTHWGYSYYLNGKRKTINAPTLEKLEEVVKQKGFKWIKF